MDDRGSAGSPAPAAASTFDRAYPPRLREEEEKILRGRRASAGASGPGGWLGVGLSGGGIRSATFSLGLFQKWAWSDGLLRRIDYLSTVSGGGYFGSFLGRLFSRDYIQKPQDVEQVLRGGDLPVPDPEGGSVNAPTKILQFLRENGRYLSPNGGGDELLAGASLLRNWVAMNLVLAVFVLGVFLGLQGIHEGAAWILSRGRDGASSLSQVGTYIPRGNGKLWWSPYLLLVPWPFLLAVFPLGWAYWMIEQAGGSFAKRRKELWDRSSLPPWVGLVVTIALSAVLWRTKIDLGLPWLWKILAVSGVAALLWWGLAAAVPLREAPRASASTTSSDLPDAGRERDREIYRRSARRNRLTLWLTWALALTGILLVLAFVDSLGQTLYVLLRRGQLGLGTAATFSSIVALAGFAQKIAAFFSKGPAGARPRLPVKLLATVAALLLVFVLLVSFDAASHAIAWKMALPSSAPQALLTEDKGESLSFDVKSSQGAVRKFNLRLPVAGPAPATPPTTRRDLHSTLYAFLVTLLLSWLFGRTWPFVNRSSHHSLYASRLTRAYLGASNPARWKGGPSVTQVIPEDDVDMARYWPPPSDKATPLHLINVTINETVDGRSQVQQQDRKGTGMALGPCGLSVGSENHAVIAFGKDQVFDPYDEPVDVYPKQGFRVFRWEENAGKTPFKGENLTLGEWVGVSGAAFSTGLGAQTSLGISLLAGFANVRLGRWWDAGVQSIWHRRRWFDSKLGVTLENALAWAFPVQLSLFDEFLARFPGTARSNWYLSDGGHFENMGGYELIRRRLPFIVIVDAEEDVDFEFGGIANLVRKARLDFGAEIEFLEEGELARLPKALGERLAGWVGPLEHLRRGSWENGALKEADRAGVSRAHAALARVTYDTTAPPSALGFPAAEPWLVYIKPTLTGDEPADVLEYHRSHPDFPHEPTIDQFFDEAQWESYRKLGEHVAGQVLPLLLDGIRLEEEPPQPKAPA